MIGQIFYSTTNHNQVYGFKIVSIETRNAIRADCELLEEYKDSDNISYDFEEYNQKVYFNKTPTEKTNIFDTKKEAVKFAVKNMAEKIDFAERDLKSYKKQMKELESQL